MIEGAWSAMQTCQACGRLRNKTAKFCTGCGTPFPDDMADGNENVSAEDRTYDPGPSQRSAVAGRAERGAPSQAKRPRRPAVILAAGLAGLGSWLLVGAGRTHTGTGTRTAAGPVADSFSSSAGAADAGPVTASPSPSPSISAAGTVTVASAVLQDADATPVANFLSSYFSAIDSRDYQAYAALLDAQMRQDLTADQFGRGYQSTADSDETLAGISTAADGDTVAMVTFTSRQNPADSVNGQEACTNWEVSLFLEGGGTGYLVGPPLAGYHASYAACP
jgi:hypothetical protein